MQIVAEKAHNKFITRVNGLEPFKIDVPKLSAYFQSTFATSFTVSDLHGKANMKVDWLLSIGNNSARYFLR